MLATVFEIIAVALILMGVIFEKRLIAFERQVKDRIEDALAPIIANIIIKWRRTSK